MEAIANLSTRIDAAMAGLEHATRSLVWIIAALVCAVLASVLGMTALLVSLWDTQHLMLLVAPGIGFAILAALFALATARTLRTAAPVMAPAAAARLESWPLPEARAAADAHGPSRRRHHPLTWIVALVSLLFLGGSREFLALALRLRAVVALLAHALHVLQLFSRRRAAPP